jgi:hypothetical protein
MKHAGEHALDALGDLLAEIRSFNGLTEKKRGVFYRRSSAFLHFHEDPAGFFADVKIGDAYRRFPVNTATQRQALRRRIARLTQSD